MKKNLFNVDSNNSSEVYGLQHLQKACDPCAAECNNDIDQVINVFDLKI